MNENWTKFIELLLQGELSPEDTAKLEAELGRNSDMRASLEQQKRVHEIAKRSGERAVVKSIGRGYRFQTKFKIGLLSVLVAGVLAIAAYFTVNSLAKKSHKEATTEMVLESSKYASLDKNSEFDNLQIIYFEHDGKDASFLSPKGVLISVPKKTFLLDGKPYAGKAVIQYQEAIDASSIVKAGLSTTSGDRLLETQGMFGLKAFTSDGRELKINDKDGIYLQVPVDENKKGMQLFQGVKNAEGAIDWQNPAPIEKMPLQANMLDLDLFPPGFEPKLDELKWNKKKKKRDSLYLSFEEVFAQESARKTNQTVPENPDTISVVMSQGQSLATDPADFQGVGGNVIDAAFDYTSSVPSGANDDTIVSQANTAGIVDTKCELPPSKVLAIWKKDFNGTILATRDFEKRMEAIHKVCDEKVFDVYANQINKPMWQLDEQVVRMGYSSFQKFANQRIGGLKQDNVHMNTLRQFYKSNVSRLKDMAKKDKNFDKAIRMAWDRKLSQQRNSSVKDAIKRARAAFQEEYNMNLDNMLNQLGRKKSVGVTIRGNSYGANRSAFNSDINESPRERGTSTSVYNIDAFTRVNTRNRTSGEFTDKNGKKAKLIYSRMKAKIKNAAKYSQLFMYLLPKELNSFQRINPVKGAFDYSLNNDIQYDAVFVGIDESGYYLADKKNLKGGDLGEIKLKSVSEKEFERRIERLNEKRNSKPMSISNELTWLKTERKDYIVQGQRKRMAKFRNTMRAIVHPCSVSEGQYYLYKEPKEVSKTFESPESE